MDWVPRRIRNCLPLFNLYGRDAMKLFAQKQSLLCQWLILLAMLFTSAQSAFADTLPIINSFTARPTTINAGGSTVLSWNITNPGALWISADNGGDVGDVRGKTSVTVKPTVTTRYTMTASSGAGNVTRSVIVTVNALKTPTISSFAPAKSTIVAGESTTLNWSVANATSLTLTPGGTVTGTTSATVTPSATTTYTLKATNASGSTSKTTTVTVATMPVISAFTASASSVVAGTQVHLSWTVSAGATLSLSPGGAVSGTGIDVTPTVSTNYVLTATTAGGSTTASLLVDVTPPPPVPVISSFAATAPGADGSATLSWNVTGANTVTIDQGIGSVTGNSITVTPSATTTYTLSATNDAGTATAQATVIVPVVGATVVSVHQIRQDWGQSTWSSSSVLLSNLQAGDAIIVIGMYWVSSGTTAAPTDTNGQLLAAVNQVPAYQHPPVAAQIYYALNVAAGDHNIVPPDLAFGGDGTLYVLQVRGLNGLRAVGDTHLDATGIQSITTQLTSGSAVAGDFVVAVGGEDDTQAFGLDAGMSAPPPGWQPIGVQNDAINNVPSAAYYTTSSAGGNQSVSFHWNDTFTNVAGAAVAAFSVNPTSLQTQAKAAVVRKH